MGKETSELSSLGKLQLSYQETVAYCLCLSEKPFTFAAATPLP